MNAKILHGNPLASNIKRKIKTRIEERLAAQLKRPSLAVILIGNDEASKLYVQNKQNACELVGILSRPYFLKETITQTEVLRLIETLNNDPDIDGILVQLPLPIHIDTGTIVEQIDPFKDVDGFHPYNIGRLVQRRPLFRPCTPAGIMLLLDSIDQHWPWVQTMNTNKDLVGTRKNAQGNVIGMNATVIGVSDIVGRPMILELLMANYTVTACHRNTHDLKPMVEQADILIVATGHPHLIKGEWIKEGAIIIDVGMNRLADGQLVGDVEFETAQKRASYITPVPGGVGPMTVACLLQNTLMACELKQTLTQAKSE